MTEILRIPVDRELGARARWLIDLRWFALTVAAIVILGAEWWLGLVLPVRLLLMTLGLIAACNLGFGLLARSVTHRAVSRTLHVTLLHGQLVTDLLGLTALMHFSGGLENPFSAFYVILVVVASILTSRRVSYLYASIATALWVGLLLAEASGVLPHHNLQGFRVPTRYREPGHLVAASFVILTANVGVAHLSSGIMARLREGEGRLYEANALLYEANSSCEARAEQLAELNRKLQEMDRSRSMFIRVVTHELRAPVAAIQSYLRLVLEGYVPQERLMEIVAKAEQRALDQLELIGDLLDLTRVQEPRAEVERAPVDCPRVLRDVLDLMAGRTEAKVLAVSVDVALDVPCALANEEHIKQVWTNLISNAIKYTPDGGQVTIRLGEVNGMVRGSVQDTGIGMHPEELKHVFDGFFRTSAAKAMAAHGTGLGLSIVKGIMERHGGCLWVESEVGVGSTFTFELPAAPP